MRVPGKTPFRDKNPSSGSASSYEVGYGRPPKHTQFRKGESGNPGGKPKRKKPEPSPIQTFYNVLEEKITLSENGNERRVSVLEALMMKTLQSALKGNTAVMATVLRFIDRNPTNPTVAAEENDMDMSDELFRKIELMAERIQYNADVQETTFDKKHEGETPDKDE